MVSQSSSAISVTRNGATSDKGKFTVSVVLDDGPYPTLVRVTPINNFFSKNTFNVTKYGTTDIPTVVETQFTDLTKTRIYQITSIILTGIKIAAPAAAPPPPLPVEGTKPQCSDDLPSPVPVLLDYRPGVPLAIPFDGADRDFWQLTVTARNEKSFEPRNVIARDLYKSWFLASGSPYDAKAEASAVWPIIVCEDVIVQVWKKGEEYLSFLITIVDPNCVQLVGLPEQGKITMRPVCGADITNAPLDKYAIAFDAMSAAETSFNNLREQWRKINK